MKIYLDTNIIIDFISRKRKESFSLVDAGIQCKYSFVISDHTLFELARVGVSAELFLKVLAMYKKWEKCSVLSIDLENAKKDTRTHVADALHIVLCEKTKCDCLLTSNIKDYRHYNKAKVYDDIK